MCDPTHKNSDEGQPGDISLRRTIVLTAMSGQDRWRGAMPRKKPEAMIDSKVPFILSPSHTER